jgi:integrase
LAIGSVAKDRESVTRGGFLARPRIRERVGNRLTANAVALALTPGNYADGNGLWLVVDAPERRYWHFRYQWQGRQRSMSLGSADKIVLDVARKMHTQARSLVARGVDPLAERRSGVTVATPSPVYDPVSPNFATVVEEYLAAHDPGWKHPKHRQQWRNTLAALYPAIGEVPIADLATSHVLRVLTPVWQTKPETASRLRGRIEAVIDYAAARGWRERGPNPATWRGHLKHLLASPDKLRQTEPHPALDWPRVPDFMAGLRTQTGMGALALQFAILTAARSGEVRGAMWDEIDLTTGTWTIPAKRMKAGRQHRVPLSCPALMILLKLAEVRDGSGLIFFGVKRGVPLSDMTLTAVVRRMGRDDLTVHGFRSTFRDWCADNGKPADAAERALAHVIGNKTRGAYERTDLLDVRRPLMNEWAAFLARPAGEIVTLRPGPQEAAGRVEAVAAPVTRPGRRTAL